MTSDGLYSYTLKNIEEQNHLNSSSTERLPKFQRLDLKFRLAVSRVNLNNSGATWLPEFQ